MADERKYTLAEAEAQLKYQACSSDEHAPWKREPNVFGQFIPPGMWRCECGRVLWIPDPHGYQA